MQRENHIWHWNWAQRTLTYPRVPDRANCIESPLPLMSLVTDRQIMCVFQPCLSCVSHRPYSSTTVALERLGFSLSALESTLRLFWCYEHQMELNWIILMCTLTREPPPPCLYPLPSYRDRPIQTYAILCVVFLSAYITECQRFQLYMNLTSLLNPQVDCHSLISPCVSGSHPADFMFLSFQLQQPRVCWTRKPMSR